MDAIALLREDHIKVLAMIDELEAKSRSAPLEDSADRKRLVTELVRAESAHEAIEEQFFWPSVQHWLTEGRRLAAPALEQEQEQAAKHMLEELDKLEPGDPGFETLLARVIADAREHIAYEEREVWPSAQRIARSELEEIGKKMAIAKKAAPTRPHPHTPPKSGVLKTAGVAAAAVDRMRDAAAGRGKD
jgi:hemerythrin-like domain-containing protein